MEELIRKLSANLSKEPIDLDMESNTSKIYIEYALANPYQKPTDEKMSSFASELDEFKFNQKLQIIAEKKSLIPNLQDVSNLANEIGETPRLTYEEFQKIGDQTKEEMNNRYFTAEVFDMFDKDPHDVSIDSQEFLKYVQRGVDIETVQYELLQYADTFLKSVTTSSNPKFSPSLIFMTEPEIEGYIADSIPHIPLLTSANLHDTFLPFYIFTAVRKIFFFLDPLKTKRINISKLSHSQEIDEFLWLQRLDQYREDYATQRAYQKEIDTNWFSASNAIRLYEAYSSSDKDGNGMLNQRELILFRGVPKRGQTKMGVGQTLGSNAIMLTPLAVSRIFQENIAHQPTEMDYKCFLDLILAIEYRDRPESLKYLFRLIDINHDGLLTVETITQFYRDIRLVLAENGYDAAPSTKDVCVEVMDMLGNPEPEENDQKRKSSSSSDLLTQGVSFKQLQSCGQGSTVLWILLDANQFWLYDNRESLPPPDENDEDEEEEESPYSSDENDEYENNEQRSTTLKQKYNQEEHDEIYSFY